VFTDGEKWRLRLLIVFLSHGAADATLDPGLWREPVCGKIRIDFEEVVRFGISGGPLLAIEFSKSVAGK